VRLSPDRCWDAVACRRPELPGCGMGPASPGACRQRPNTARRAHRWNRTDSWVHANPTAAETVMDIEDLGRLGRGGGPCPYYASRALAEAAELVFMPYNYLARPAAPGPRRRPAACSKPAR